jgi:DNA-binding NarL/FixJ family response regulator
VTAPDAQPIRVLIADDQALVRGAFEILINSAPGMTTVATAADGAEAVDLAAREQPDVVLMDVRMPHMDGIDATREITKAHAARPIRVLILTTFDLDDYVFAALRAGASGFILKDTPPTELINAVAVIAAGDALLAPTVTRRLIDQFTRRPEPARTPRLTLDGLTARETQVLTLVALGLSNTDIAAHLHLAPPTVKTHIGRLLTKLTARDRAQLVIAAYETGLIAPGGGV